MRLNRPTLLSDASIHAADVQVPDGIRILKFIPRDWMYISVCVMLMVRLIWPEMVIQPISLVSFRIL